MDRARRATTAALLITSLSGAAAAQRSEVARGARFQRLRMTGEHGARFDVDAVSVDLCDAAISPRVTAPSEGARTVSSWAREVGAVAAVNGDYFDGRTMQPLGPARGAGHDWRAGLREHRDALLAFDPSSQPHLLDAPDSTQPTVWNDASTRLDASWPDVIAVRERVLRNGVTRESPAIVHDGERHPRTAIGLSADRHTMWLAVVDGRSESSSGATTNELADAMRRLGANDAMKLDGGGSSTLWVRGRGVVNHPSDGHERVVAMHFGIVVRDGVTGRRAWCVDANAGGETRSGRAPGGAYAVLGGVVAAVVGGSERRLRRRSR
jgi:hypothetical protein